MPSSIFCALRSRPSMAWPTVKMHLRSDMDWLIASPSVLNEVPSSCAGRSLSYLHPTSRSLEKLRPASQASSSLPNPDPSRISPVPAVIHHYPGRIAVPKLTVNTPIGTRLLARSLVTDHNLLRCRQRTRTFPLPRIRPSLTVLWRQQPQ